MVSIVDMNSDEMQTQQFVDISQAHQQQQKMMHPRQTVSNQVVNPNMEEQEHAFDDGSQESMVYTTIPLQLSPRMSSSSVQSNRSGNFPANIAMCPPKTIIRNPKQVVRFTPAQRAINAHPMNVYPMNVHPMNVQNTPRNMQNTPRNVQTTPRNVQNTPRNVQQYQSGTIRPKMQAKRVSSGKIQTSAPPKQPRQT